MSEVITALKQLQADATVFYMKVHNFHWNAKGADFYPTHLATEEVYEAFATVFDDLAERIIQLGDKPYVTLADMLKVAKIKEETKNTFHSKDICQGLLADYQYFVAEFKKLSELADGAKDKATAAYADDQVATLEKKIWMLQAQLA